MSFDGVVEFVAVAEAQGFSAAARRFGVSTSYISRKIQALEQRLGVVLLARSTRKVRLTEAGQQYYERVQELVYGLQEANETISGDQVALSGTLRVSAAGEFAEQYIAPALIAFAEQHPALSLEIDFNSRMVDFVQEGIDFSIRYGRLTDSSLIARKLVDRSLMAVASKDYLAKYGEPKHPRDLHQHRCLVAINDQWLFEEDKQPLRIRVKGQWKSNSGRSLVKACERGLGIAYMPKSSYGELLNNPEIQPILQPYWTKGITTWIVYASRRFMPARSRLAINYLLEHFKDWQE